MCKVCDVAVVDEGESVRQGGRFFNLVVASKTYHNLVVASKTYH